MSIPNYTLEIPRLNTNFSNYNFGNVGGFTNFGSYGNFGTGLWGIQPSVTTPSKKAEKKEETYDEYIARTTKEDKEAKEKERAAQEKKEMEKPLTEKEKEVLRKSTLDIDAKNNKKAEGSMASCMLFSTPFLIPTIKQAFTPKKEALSMFYKDGAAHMDLFTKNPDLMTNAQEAMQKLEKKYAADIRALKGNDEAIKAVEAERDLFRDLMETALKNKNADEIAKATAECQTAAGVKNGFFKRLFRAKNDKFHNRRAAVNTAKAANNLPISKPAEGTSFFRNMCCNKISLIMSAGMVVLPVALDWKNIKQARSIDKENKQNGNNTHYARKQVAQTAIKSATNLIVYNAVDAAAKTVLKKSMGTIAKAIATKLATKGAGKALGAALGSVVPGVGTAVGMLLGSAVSFLVSKYVIGNIKFFNNSGVKEAQTMSASDQELLSSLSEQYMTGAEMDQQAVNILKKKVGETSFKELKRVHDMPEKERNEYMAQLQQQMQQQQADPTKKDVATA